MAGKRQGILRNYQKTTEHYVDIVGVAGSIPAAPTTGTPRETNTFHRLKMMAGR